MVLVALAGFVFMRGGDSGGGGAGEIFLEPAADTGPAPFTPTVAAPPPVPIPAPDPAAPETTVTAPANTTALQATSGSRPGLYGGTRNNSSCDKAQLTSFLQQNPDKAGAFASVVGVAPAEVPAYIAKLTPVTLRSDTRVTNHGFANGKPTPRQTVLQAGSAVLADDRGVPRVRCACGNPLAPPSAVQARPTYTGKAWPGFSPTNVAVVAASQQPVPALVLSDPVTSASFARPVGTDGASDGPPGPPIPDPTAATPDTTTTPPTSRPAAATTTTTAEEVDVPLPNADVTRDGTVSASSTFSADSSPSAAVDGDTATSWFSSGPEAGGTTTFTWTGTRDELITAVAFVGNKGHGDPSLRNGTGFASVTVEVLDDVGDSDFSETVQLNGTPDPDVLVRPGVEGRSVRLTFRGPENPARAGFAELKIGVTR